MDNYVIILRTCDKFLKYSEGILYTLEKYWKNHPKVYFLSYESPKFKLPNTWEHYSMGKDNGAQIWSNGFIDFFNDYPEIDYFLFLLDDMFFLDTVDVKQIEYLVHIMKNDSNVGKIQISGSHAKPKDNIPIENSIYNNSDLGKLRQNSQYRLSTLPAIWKKDFFLKYMEKNLNPWEFELQHPKNDGIDIYTVRTNRPISLSHFFRRGNEFLSNKWYISHTDDKVMKEEDKKIIAEMFNWKL